MTKEEFLNGNSEYRFISDFGGSPHHVFAWENKDGVEQNRAVIVPCIDGETEDDTEERIQKVLNDICSGNDKKVDIGMIDRFIVAS